VQRLIALPGDWIQIPEKREIRQVPDGHCWVEGDNAGSSWDSRHYGPVRHSPMMVYSPSPMNFEIFIVLRTCLAHVLFGNCYSIITVAYQSNTMLHKLATEYYITTTHYSTALLSKRQAFYIHTNAITWN
jgi:hypothetical protein